MPTVHVVHTTYRPGDRIPMSWDDYESLGEFRGEYIDGELVVSPEPTRRHQMISSRLWHVLSQQLPPGTEAVQAWGFMPWEREEFAPGVLVCTSDEDKRLTASIPHLLVEVLSSDPARDLLRKAAKYAAAHVPHYWVIDPGGPEIIEHRLPPGAAAYVEVARHAGDQPVTLDIDVCRVTIVPGELAG